MKYSVFTVCIPEYKPADAVQQLKKWGYEGVEWRFYERPENIDPKAGFWGGNLATIDPRHWEKEIPEVKKLCKAAGLATPSLAAYAGCWQPERYEPALAAAAALGAPIVRIGVPGYDPKIGFQKQFKDSLKAYEKVVKVAAKHKVKPVIEIHMNMLAPSASAAFNFCRHFSDKEIGVIYDPGNMIYEGYEQYQMGLEILGKYLAHVHMKNGRWDIVGGTPEGAVKWSATWAAMKTGFCDFEKLISALKAVGYDGWLSFEDFNAAKKTDEKMPENIKFIQAIEKRVTRELAKAKTKKK